ncbi:hypothetical protein JCM10450v2_004985 [Rhodotorula kratochvilovae]
MNPSPSSSAPPPPRASFASLPLELVKQIVAEVHEQDKAWANVQRAVHAEPSAYGPRRPPPAEQEKRAQRADVGVDAVWSYWYRRGVAALSYVDKRTRSLTLPYLVGTITNKQLGKTFANYVLGGSPLAAHVRQVEFLYDAPSEKIRTMIPVLYVLPNLRALSFDFFNFAALAYPDAHVDEPDNWYDMVSAVLGAVAPRIEELEVEPDGTDGLPSVLSMISRPGALRDLRLRVGELPFCVDDQEGARGALEELSLRSFTVIDISDSDVIAPHHVVDPVHPNWLNRFRLPTLTSFRLDSPYTLPVGFFDLLTSAFPNLEHLDLSFQDRGTPGPHPAIPSTITLPTLRSLTLKNGYHIHGPAVLADLVHAFRTSPRLGRLKVDSRGVSAENELPRLFPANVPLPQPLRTVVVVTYHSLPERAKEDARAAAAWGAAHGIRVGVVCPERPAPTNPAVAARTHARLRTTPATEQYIADSVGETLAWASRRVDGLRRAGDLAGLQELAEAVHPLRERQYIEEM